MFWILALCFGCMSMIYYRFLSVISDFLVFRFKYTLIEASNIITLLPILNMILIPLTSTIVNSKGKKAAVLMSSNLVALGIYAALLFLPVASSWLVMLLVLSLSIFFSMYISTIWSSISLSLPTQATVMGCGCCTLT